MLKPEQPAEKIQALLSHYRVTDPFCILEKYCDAILEKFDKHFEIHTIL